VATVSQICDMLAQSIPMPAGEVRKYARELINSGDLPKAIGRAVPQADMRDRAKLVLAIAASERPSGCVQAMRDRYSARDRSRGDARPAGEVLADQLAQLAACSVDAFQLWNYSDLEVSRGGLPRVKFRVNEIVRHFEGFKDVDQPEFLGGYFNASAGNLTDEIAAFHKAKSGFAVSAFIPGSVLIDLAFGSREQANAATALIATKTVSPDA